MLTVRIMPISSTDAAVAGTILEGEAVRAEMLSHVHPANQRPHPSRTRSYLARTSPYKHSGDSASNLTSASSEASFVAAPKSLSSYYAAESHFERHSEPTSEGLSSTNRIVRTVSEE